MKKIFTLAISALITVTALAEGRFGEINITRLDNRKYNVEVDGRRFPVMDEAITLSNLTPGRHTVKIYAIKKGNPLFGVLGGWGKTDLIYNEAIMVKPMRQVNITIKRSNVAIAEKRMGRSHNTEDIDRWNDREDDYGYGNDRTDRNERVIVRPISENAFTSLKQILNRESFENTRLQLAKQTVTQHYFTTEQVRQLMQLFAFENNKLELAKFCYGQTVDKDNYVQLCNDLAYGRSRQELYEFVHSR